MMSREDDDDGWEWQVGRLVVSWLSFEHKCASCGWDSELIWSASASLNQL